MTAFDESLRHRIKDNIARLMTPTILNPEGVRRSAVGIIVTPAASGEAA